MRIVSWNVNGLRACVRKGFLDFLEASEADVVGIQELRALPEQLPAEARAPEGWHATFAPAERKGYSGVALFSRQPPSRVETTLGIDEYDVEGRLLIAHFGRMAIASVYFPKGSGKDRDNSRVPYKLGFYQTLFERLQLLRKRGPVFVLGDYNTAHTEIDLARPKTNAKTSGFLPEERAELTRWLDAGWSEHLPPPASGRAGALHLVAAMGQRAPGERRLAHRLRAGFALGATAGVRRLHLAAGTRFRPLPGRGRRDAVAASQCQSRVFRKAASSALNSSGFSK